MSLEEKLKDIRTNYKAETEFMIQLNDLATDYVLSVRGKTAPDLADFILIAQNHVDAEQHERAYRGR